MAQNTKVSNIIPYPPHLFFVPSKMSVQSVWILEEYYPTRLGSSPIDLRHLPFM